MNGSRKRSLLVLVIVASCVLLCLNRGTATGPKNKPNQPTAKKLPARKEKPKEKTPLQKFMRAKLGGSSQILEGLVTEKFDLIQKGTTELGRISSAAKWRVSNDAMYRQYSNEFQQKVSRLEEMAKAKKLDGAALAYIEVSMSCIECHKWVRAVLIAENGLNSSTFQNIPPASTRQTELLKLSPFVASEAQGSVLFLTSTPAPCANPSDDRPSNIKPIPPKRMNPSQPAIRVFMRAKLANSQTTLEGLVTEDFGKVQTGAEKMLVMSHAASWFVVKTPKYDEHTTEFRRNARQLIKMAKKANIDGATLSYLQLTMNCINCHNHMRSVKTVWFKPAKHNIVDSHDFQPQSASYASRPLAGKISPAAHRDVRVQLGANERSLKLWTRVRQPNGHMAFSVCRNTNEKFSLLLGSTPGSPSVIRKKPL